MMKQTRSTVAKTEIFKHIEQSPVALSHADLVVLLQGICDRVTIYRVLDRLILEGSIHRIATVQGIIKYAICKECTQEKHHHNHIHFSCEACQETLCMTDVEPVFTLPGKYKIRSVNFSVSGVCPKCA